MLSAQRSIESNLRQQNELLKSEKRQLSKEVEELKNRLKMLEFDKQNIGRAQEQWRKEKQILLKKIELVSLLIKVHNTNIKLIKFSWKMRNVERMKPFGKRHYSVKPSKNL